MRYLSVCLLLIVMFVAIMDQSQQMVLQCIINTMNPDQQKPAEAQLAQLSHNEGEGGFNCTP